MSEIIYTGKETLQPLATKIKTLGGVEDSITLAEMEDSVKAANEGLAAQATTIAEIAALLEGKSVPGGGASIDTCSVSFYTYGGYCNVYATRLNNGAIEAYESEEVGAEQTITIDNILCNSIATIKRSSGVDSMFSGNGYTVLNYSNGIIKLTAAAGETVIIQSHPV